jgi:hypothetical protein
MEKKVIERPCLFFVYGNFVLPATIAQSTAGIKSRL